MPDLKILRILDRMPALYRDALDRRCRAACGYGGKRPRADQLVDWSPDSPETDEIERLTGSLADLDSKLATARILWKEARQLYRVNRSVRHQRTMTKLGKQAKSLKKRQSSPGYLTLTSATNRGFTGQEHLADTALIHMNARVYDLQIGKFNTPDPMNGPPAGAGDWNRYAYVGNNPLNATDPTGMQFHHPGGPWGGGFSPAPPNSPSVLIGFGGSPPTDGVDPTTDSDPTAGFLTYQQAVANAINGSQSDSSQGDPPQNSQQGTSPSDGTSGMPQSSQVYTTPIGEQLALSINLGLTSTGDVFGNDFSSDFQFQKPSGLGTLCPPCDDGAIYDPFHPLDGPVIGYGIGLGGEAIGAGIAVIGGAGRVLQIGIQGLQALYGMASPTPLDALEGAQEIPEVITEMPPSPTTTPLPNSPPAPPYRLPYPAPN